MRWRKYSIRTLASAEEQICAMLDGLGYGSVEIEDSQPVDTAETGGLFGDVVPERTGEDPAATVSFYTEEDEDRETVLARVRERLHALRSFLDIGEGTVEESVTEDADWINNWKEHFHRFYVDDILIVPTWDDGDTAEEKAAMILRMDPGVAFGTGAHESTRLAIRALRRFVKKGDRVLDIGCGSGILGIVALKSGAAEVFATDLDPNVLPAVADNLAQNDLPDGSIVRILGNIADDRQVQEAAGFGKYDIACANIIAEILADVSPAVPPYLKRGGIYITSGILTEKEHIVAEAARKAGLSHVLTDRMGEWSSMVFRK